MNIIFISTHLVMVLCGIAVCYLALIRYRKSKGNPEGSSFEFD